MPPGVDQYELQRRPSEQHREGREPEGQTRDRWGDEQSQQDRFRGEAPSSVFAWQGNTRMTILWLGYAVAAFALAGVR